MSITLCMLDLARKLAQIASETSEPDTAVKLIALANEVLVSAGHLPEAGDHGSGDGNGQAPKP
jgi:hypothetical protein